MNKILIIAIFVVSAGIIWQLSLPKSEVIQTIVIPTKTPIPAPKHLDAEKLFNLVNDYRASQGLNKLASSSAMCPFAFKRLSQIPYDWSHTGFYPEVKSYYTYVDAGENLGRGYDDEEIQLKEWINSPSHKKNLDKPSYTHTCIAVGRDIDLGTNQQETFVVEEFASF